MPTFDPSVYDLIELGRHMLILRNPGMYTATVYRESGDAVLDFADKCGFTALRDAARQLKETKFLKDLNTDMIMSNDRLKLGYNAKTMTRLLKEEANRRSLRISDIKPPDELSNLVARSGKPLKAHQQALQSDAITCLKMQLARPAIVSAWALGFDLVRSWVFDDPSRLTAFNAQIGSPVVTDYHDLFRVTEVKFLEVCRDSQDTSLIAFTHKTFRKLEELLDHRNEFAHANYAQATPAEANVFVERMIRVVTGPPFDK